MEIFDAIAKYGPQYLPILVAILVIVFTKTYVYKGMVPEKMLKDQIQREQQMLKDQVEREHNIVEVGKDLENRLEEIVRQLESLTQKISEEIGENNQRIASLERFLSDQLDAIRELTYNFEKHRKGIPDTQVFQKERSS
jgi:peptidoglycan hydrolase CwlO-like protein